MNYTPLVDQVLIAGELTIIAALLVVILRLTIDDISWALALRSCRKGSRQGSVVSDQRRRRDDQAGAAR
jgi:hypothetical protein